MQRDGRLFSRDLSLCLQQRGEEVSYLTNGCSSYLCDRVGAQIKRERHQRLEYGMPQEDMTEIGELPHVES